MAQKKIALCPTLAASEAYARYFEKWDGREPAPESVQENRRSFQLAMKAGVSLSWAATSASTRMGKTGSRWTRCAAPHAVGSSSDSRDVRQRAHFQPWRPGRDPAGASR